MTRHLLIPLLFVALLASRVAIAEEGAPDEEVERSVADFDELVAGAMDHYGNRRYEEAIELFLRALEQREEPELVYNIARSHERLARAEEAVQWYERFLALPGTTGELRARARANLNSLRQELVALEASRRAAEPAVAPPPAPPTPAPVVEERSGGLGLAGYVLLGVGGVAVVLGVVFDALALVTQSDFAEAGLDAGRLQLRDELETRALVGDVLLFTGAAVLVTGLVLAVIDGVRRRAGRAQGRRTRWLTAQGWGGLGAGRTP